ncbi:hypothetical protein CAC42_5282 [Sphaceloma murrayae]|uniref:Uncharacterized protein n=1 Tax=Sphaceloma murrayae TaxID=2082308 RepID=A0A2K1QV31_9PEZI|nr:hypothetical protein CAC42_5282 [Sphaceloma murrayae]
MDSPKRNWLFTYPRTASNLLLKVLDLKNQPVIYPGNGLFLPIMMTRQGQLMKSGVTPLDSMTPENRTALMDAYTAGIAKVTTAASASPSTPLFISEHACWLTEPVARTTAMLGADAAKEDPWTVPIPDIAPAHSATNETFMPDAFLLSFAPSFIIRHPALALTSMYRAQTDMYGPQMALMSLKSPWWQEVTSVIPSRKIYDWYVSQFPQFDPAAPGVVSWPIVLDADDILSSPDVVRKYAAATGLDEAKLKFEWEPERKPGEAFRGPKFQERFSDTIANSTGIRQDKKAGEIDVAKEVSKWKTEFGDEAAVELEKRLKEEMESYEYLRAKRLTA